jgi:hypothetical protein
MHGNVDEESWMATDNVVGTIQWTPRYGKPQFPVCNNGCICNDPLPGQDKMHPHRGMVKNLLCHRLRRQPLCTLGGPAGTGFSHKGRSKLCMLIWWEQFLTHATC